MVVGPGLAAPVRSGFVLRELVGFARLFSKRPSSPSSGRGFASLASDMAKVTAADSSQPPNGWVSDDRIDPQLLGRRGDLDHNGTDMAAGCRPRRGKNSEVEAEGKYWSWERGTRNGKLKSNGSSEVNEYIQQNRSE